VSVGKGKVQDRQGNNGKGRNTRPVLNNRAVEDQGLLSPKRAAEQIRSQVVSKRAKKKWSQGVKEHRLILNKQAST
jgi:hypothetical protein